MQWFHLEISILANKNNKRIIDWLIGLFCLFVCLIIYLDVQSINLHCLLLKVPGCSVDVRGLLLWQLALRFNGRWGFQHIFQRRWRRRKTKVRTRHFHSTQSRILDPPPAVLSSLELDGFRSHRVPSPHRVHAVVAKLLAAKPPTGTFEKYLFIYFVIILLSNCPILNVLH